MLLLQKYKGEKMEFRIQSLVFPSEEKHLQCRKLFYKGDRGILDRENGRISLGYAQHCDFTTYLNACSYQKWQKYTGAGSLKLHLDIKGHANITLIGYDKKAISVNSVEFLGKRISIEKRSTISLQYPDNDEQMVGFEITALDKCTIYGGYYTVEVEKKDMQDVVLSLATTTCHKEDFIKKNVNLIKKEIIESKEEISKNFYLHVVDNGRTLSTKEINGEHIFLHSNINSGGSGGFARGMMESLHQNPKVTHVLLMDDDVLVLPESIKRTYNLLRLLRPEYRNDFISGAMLYYEKPYEQHEDIGTISYTQDNCVFRSLKGILDHTKISDSLENEGDFIKHRNSYAAWWYCCIPAKVIEKNGLPLPIFIRCDDSEYSLRCGANIITMNGICIWHMGFTTKYNTTFDKYQQYRNLLIAQSTSGIIPEADLFRVIYSSFRIELMRFNYGAAELVVRSLEDYLKGPEFIKNANGEEITQNNFKLNDKMLPLNSLEDGALYNPADCYIDPPITLYDRIFTKVTWNGQRLCPKFMERSGVIPIGFDWAIQLHRIAGHSKLIAINPYDLTGVYRIKDKKKFEEIMKRYKNASHDFKARSKQVAQEYKESQKEITSEKFWRKYLGI